MQFRNNYKLLEFMEWSTQFLKYVLIAFEETYPLNIFNNF